MLTSSQEKTYQKIDSLFSSSSPVSETAATSSSLEEEGKKGEEMGEEIGEYPIAIKKSIEIECQGKKYAYHLGEVLRKKWNLPDVSQSSSEKEEEIQNSSSFVDDLGADSLDTVELVMALEEAFECEIPECRV